MFTHIAARTVRCPPTGSFLEVLQAIRRLLTRPECFRLEREFAGPDFHRGEQCTLARHTHECRRAGHQAGVHYEEEFIIRRQRCRGPPVGNRQHADPDLQAERRRPTRLAH